MLKSSPKNILFIFTGSIACYKACNVLSKLKQQGHNLKVVMSPSSLEFVGASTIEGLTGQPPITDMYGPGNVMDHINLMRWADMVLVAPATANYINKIAAGIGDDLLTTLFLAHDFNKPFLIAPAMNTKMYLHPVTQHSIGILKNLKIDILEAASGVLACGEIGSGRLLEPELIYQEVEKRLEQSYDSNEPAKVTSAKKIKVLITSGGTSEPIDDVRVITNKSTGKTAASIANSLIDSGIDVTYLRSQSAVQPSLSCEQITFTTFADLQSSLKEVLQKNSFDAVIHAAAVSDYSVKKQAGKVSSDENEITLTLTRNPKLISEIKKFSPQTLLIGFKLTSAADENLISKKVDTLFEKSHCDYVVQNDWQNIEKGKVHFRFYNRQDSKNYKDIDSLQSLNSILFQSISKEKL